MSPKKTLTVAAWNINGMRARQQRVLEWLDAKAPDVLCLQEIKMTDEQFPVDEFAARGYTAEVFGQKTYNGVALLGKKGVTLKNVQRGLPDDAPDAQRRLIAADVKNLRVVNVYVPNGQAVGTDKFAYKLEWLARLRAMLDAGHKPTDALLICGDFNIAPEDRDVHDPDLWRGKVLFSEPEHEALAALTGWGLTDAFRLHVDEGGHYSWWDYRNLAFQKRAGLRIDLFLVTKSLAKRCTAVTIDKDERRARKDQPDLKASDHAPVTATFSL